MGAYGLAVAAAFAVALAVLLSVASTPATNAATVTFDPDSPTTVDAEPGDTVIIPSGGTGTIVDFSISGGTASGSFDVGGNQSLSCSDSTTGKGCDTNTEPTAISVKLTVDDDSADGYIIVKRTQILPVPTGADTGVTSVVITVTTQPRPTSLTAKAAPTTIDADAAGAGASAITATIKYNRAATVVPDDAGAGELLTFVTTLGVMDCPALDDGDAVTNVQWCQVRTLALANTESTVTGAVTLRGSGREGTATVTVSHATVGPAGVDVTLFGVAKKLTAEADQGSIEQGGSVFVILTVTDAAGNPVSNAQPLPADEEVTGPEGDDTVLVNTTQVAGEAGTSPYTVNKDVDGDGVADKGDVPACGPVDQVPATGATLDEEAGDVAVFGSTGTNSAGQCAVQVNADPVGDDDATRGEHTINFVLGDDLEASVTIEVAGAPASIETDAPAYVDPLGDTKITVTVFDDEGVRVGVTNVTVRAIEGGGLIEDATGKGKDANNEDTVDGQSSFVFFAPSSGTVTLRVDAGKIQHIVSLPIGAPVEDPPDEPPSLSPAPSASGFTLVNFSGGSVEELGTVVTTSCGGGGTAYATDYQGNWVSFIPAAMIPAVNASFGALFSDGVPANTPLLIGNCGG